MAVVRFSAELKDGIIGNAKELFNKRIQTLHDNPPQILDEVASKVVEEYIPYVNTLPPEFFRWYSEAELERIGHTTYNLRGRLRTAVPAPHSKVRTSKGAAIDSGYRLDITLPDTEEFAPYKEQLDQWCSGIDALVAQRDEFVAGVKQVVNAHTTLAPALKAWPPLWELVPESYKERHRKVVERTKPSEAQLDVDLSKLTTTVVASKLVK